MAGSLVLGCLKVFFCRICDVSLGTMRTILMVKERSLFATFIGFFEVLVWYLVVRDAISFNGPVLPIAVSYAAGFATGTYVGSMISRRVFGGHVTVHVVTSRRGNGLPAALREAGFGITVLDVNGSEFGEEKNMILADLGKGELARFESLVKELDEKAFVLVQETKSYRGGYGRDRLGK